MSYRIWSQGIDSEEYAVVIEDGTRLERNDPRRDGILEIIETVKSRGKGLISLGDKLTVTEYKTLLLIQAVSEEKDRYGRGVPISILVDKATSMQITDAIRSSLRENKLLIREVDRDLMYLANQKSRSKKINRIVALVSLIMFVLASLIFYYMLKRGVG